MKNTQRTKTRITAGILSLITVFSVGTASVTTSSAATPTVSGIAKDISSFAITQAIDKFVPSGIAGSLLKMGTGYLLNWVFDSEEKKEPTVSEAIEKIDQLKSTIDKNHEEEMKSLRVINGDIKTKDFRMEAGKINDDCETAFKTISDNALNIRSTGKEVIDDTTYKAYKAILESCNLTGMEKNFKIIQDYILGKRLSIDKEYGYEATTKYLYDKLTEKYNETAHSWKDSMNYWDIVQKNINGEVNAIHFDAGMDYIAMLTLNNMAYKMREYEINKGIYKVSEGEHPYLAYENREKNLSKTMQALNEAHKKAIDANNNDSKMVKALVKLSEPVDGIREKGFRSYTEAWAQASSTGKDFTITLREDIKSNKDTGFNFDKLDQNKYGFTPQGGFHVMEGRKITVDLGGHTIDNTACSNVSAFGFRSNTFLNIKNGTIKGGENALRADCSTNVFIKMDNVTVNDTALSGIYVGAHQIGKDKAKNMKLEMNNCTVKNAKQESGVRMIPDDSTLIVNKCHFENNSSANAGGAIYLESKNETKITDSVFKNNTANNGYGGAIASILQNDPKGSGITVEGGLFEGNVSNKMGPCFHYDPETRFKGAGGAIAGPNLKINNATFKKNSTNDQAGAIFSYGQNENWMTDTAITNCTFEGNTAKHVGGAIRMFHLGDKCYVKNCRFTDNSSKGENVFVEYGHGLADKLIKEWGNTSNSKYSNGMYIVNNK